MAALTAQPITEAALAVVKSAATVTTGDTLALDSKTIAFVENGSGSPITVTVASHAAPGEGEASAAKSFSVAAGALAALHLDANAFTDPVTGLATIVCSAVTSVKVWALRH